MGMNGMIAAAMLILLILPAGHATAEEIHYDRVAFAARLIEPVAIDFEGEADGPIIGDPWLALGVVFDELGTGDNMGIADGGGVNRNIYALGGEEADIQVSFPTTPTIAFGLGIFSNDIQDPSERIIFYGQGDLVLLDIEMPHTGVQTDAFIGFIADEPILRVELTDADDTDYFGIGDVIFAGDSVPTAIESWSSIKQFYR
jgi:hypothetical protein